MFAPLAQQLEADFTTISFDLPGHGQTNWPAGKLLIPKLLAASVQDLCREKGVNHFSLAAFSLGGRVALSLFSEAPQSVAQMVLAAPDGLIKNRLQTLALNSGLGKKLAADLVQHPARYHNILEGLRRRGILSPARYGFLQSHLGNPASLLRLQEGLLPLRKFAPDMPRVRRQIQKGNTPVHLLMGVSDTVIPIAQGEVFVKDLPSTTLHRLAKSHRLFDWDTVQQMAQLLRKNP